MQALNQLIGIKLLISGFLNILVFSFNFQGEQMPVWSPADAHDSMCYHHIQVAA